MSLVAGLLRPRLFSSKLSKLKAMEKDSGSATICLNTSVYSLNVANKFLLFLYRRLHTLMNSQNKQKEWRIHRKNFYFQQYLMKLKGQYNWDKGIIDWGSKTGL
jgi:hypothetical protein